MFKNEFSKNYIESKKQLMTAQKFNRKWHTNIFRSVQLIKLCRINNMKQNCTIISSIISINENVLQITRIIQQLFKTSHKRDDLFLN